MKNKTFSKGFTIIELMIVMAIIAVLVSIAYPSYNWAIIKGKRAQGRTAVLALMLQQERYLTQKNTYLFFTNSTGTTSPATLPFATYSGDTGINPAYWLAASACGAAAATECVTITATPTFQDDEAGSLSLTSTGVKSCTGTESSTVKVCWP